MTSKVIFLLLLNLVSLGLIIFIGIIVSKPLINYFKALKDSNSEILYLNTKKSFKRILILSIISYLIAVIAIIIDFFPSVGGVQGLACIWGIIPLNLFATNISILNNDSIIINLVKKVEFKNIKYVKLNFDKHNKEIIDIYTCDSNIITIRGKDSAAILNLYPRLLNIATLKIPNINNLKEWFSWLWIIFLIP